MNIKKNIFLILQETFLNNKKKKKIKKIEPNSSISNPCLFIKN